MLALLDQMSDNARVVFNLRAVEGYSFVEIAQMLDKKEGTVRTIYMRARKWLMKRLKEK
jgi:RNA polymerase sigma factor (sigma-70 family)